MRLSLVILVFVIAALLVGGYFIFAHQGGAVAIPGAVNATTIQNAWVEVASDSVYLDVAREKTLLKSGDSVGVGATIETGPTGAAVVHFPDASLARIDVNTTITLSAISFNTNDDSLVVGIGLSIGRVWSKVIGLATPQSRWEVRTSNTVATVRGTAFAVGYKNGTSFVLGSQRSVAVAPIDPKTKKEIAYAEVALDEGTLIQLTDADAAAASTATGSSTIAAKITPITDDFRTDAWVRAEQAADKQLDAKIDALRAEGASDASVREKLRAEDVKLQKTFIRTPEVTSKVTPVETQTNTVVPPTPEVRTTVTQPVTIIPPAAITKATTRVRASRTVSDLIEDNTVQFTAVVGTGRDAGDVTSQVLWSVTGSIGSITSKGVFTAHLGSDVSEFGQDTGSVIGTLPNGDVIQSAPIHVQAKVDTSSGTDG